VDLKALALAVVKHMKLGALVVPSLLTACAGPSDRFLTKQQQAGIERIELVVLLPRPNTTLAQQFLHTPGPAYQRLEAFDAIMQSPAFKARLAAVFKNKLDGTVLRTPPDVVFLSWEGSRKEAFKQANASAVLFLKLRGIATGGLILEAEATLYPVSERLKKLRPKPDDSNPLSAGNAIFHQSLTYREQLGDIDFGWRRRLDAAIAEAVDNLAAQLATLLNHGL
jgi:hypothetical protein